MNPHNESPCNLLIRLKQSSATVKEADNMGDIECPPLTMHQTTFSPSTISLLGHALQDIEELQQLCTQGVADDTNNGVVLQNILDAATKINVLCKKGKAELKIPERTSSKRFDHGRANIHVEANLDCMASTKSKHGILKVPQPNRSKVEDVGRPGTGVGCDLWTISEECSSKEDHMPEKNREAQDAAAIAPEGKKEKGFKKNGTLENETFQSSIKPQHSKSKLNHTAKPRTELAEARSAVQFHVEETETSPLRSITTPKCYATGPIAILHRSKPLSSTDSLVEQLSPRYIRHIHGDASGASPERFLMSGALPASTNEPLPSVTGASSQSIPLFEKLDRFRERTMELRFKISSLKSKEEAATHESTRNRMGLKHP